MTPEQRAAAERLVEGGEPSNRLMPDELQAWADDAAHLLRELLAAEPVQEPVAWGVFVDDELFKPFNCKDEAVDWFQAQYNHGSRYDYLVLPLYTHPPQQRRPLSDDEALALIRATPQEDVTQEGWIRRQRLSWVRAIERAHGIGEQE